MFETFEIGILPLLPPPQLASLWQMANSVSKGLSLARITDFTYYFQSQECFLRWRMFVISKFRKWILAIQILNSVHSLLHHANLILHFLLRQYPAPLFIQFGQFGLVPCFLLTKGGSYIRSHPTHRYSLCVLREISLYKQDDRPTDIVLT